MNDNDKAIRKAILIDCPAKTEATTLNELFTRCKPNLPLDATISDFSRVAQQMVEHGMLDVNDGKYFDPQKTTRFPSGG